MNVVWSSSSSSAETDAIVPTLQPNNVANFTSTNATITGTDYRTLNNVSASFTEPGQTVTYNLFVYNAGQYPAYLTDLTMGNKSCSAITENVELANQATQSLVQAACEGISISVTIGTKTLSSSGFLDNQALAPNTSVAAQVVITYAAGSAYVDGPMEVSFGDITFTASTIQGAAPVNPWTVAPINLTSANVVYDETYTMSGSSNGLPDTFELDSSSAVMITDDGSMEATSGNNLANGITFGTNYMLVDVDAYMDTSYNMCQLFVFDGPGTATGYLTFDGNCTYDNLIASSSHNTYSVN